MDESPSDQPERFRELLRVHGKLDPLVNVNMKPDTHVKVQVGVELSRCALAYRVLPMLIQALLCPRQYS